MKHFKFLGIAALMSAAMLPLASCGEDDDNEPGDNNNGFAAVGQADATWGIANIADENSEYSSTDYYNYIENKRVASVINESYYSQSYHYYSTYYTYSSDEITWSSYYTKTPQYSPTQSGYYSVNNGLVRADDDVQFQYNQSRQLTRCATDDDYYSFTPTWSGNLITKIDVVDGDNDYGHDKYSATISYTSTTNIDPGCFRALNAYTLNEVGLGYDYDMGISGLYGMLPQKLITEFSWSGTNDLGHIKKVAYSDIDSGGCPHRITYTMRNGAIRTYTVDWQKI